MGEAEKLTTLHTLKGRGFLLSFSVDGNFVGGREGGERQEESREKVEREGFLVIFEEFFHIKRVTIIYDLVFGEYLNTHLHFFEGGIRYENTKKRRYGGINRTIRRYC